MIKKTNPPRGPLNDQWILSAKEKNIPVMCAYKIVRVKFEVWGFQNKVEAWTHKVFIYYLNLLITLIV